MTTNKLSIDADETSTSTAATAPTLTDTSLASGALITIDIDQIGSSTAGAGLKVYLTGYQSQIYITKFTFQVMEECRKCDKPLKSSRKRLGICSDCEVKL